MTADLFSSYDLAGRRLPNRVVMAPMTRSRATDDGTPTALMARYYVQRAEAGLIVSEGTNITAQGQGFFNTPGIFTDDHVAGWSAVTRDVHAAGGSFFLQLWHVGRVSHSDNMLHGLHPVAPSAIAHPRTIVTRKGPQPMVDPRAMTLDEVHATVGDYAEAARRAIAAGCDGVEIHAANGYLPSQFLHSTSNLRRDAYGGSIANRARFLIEVAQACASAVGAQRVGVRLSPFSPFNGAMSDDEPDLCAYLIPALADLGLAYLHAVRADVSGNTTVDLKDGEEVIDVLKFVRPLWPHTLIAAGNFHLAGAQEIIRSGMAELVAFGRDFIANPDLVTRLQKGHPLAQRNPAEWYGQGPEGYTTYPRWGSVASAPALQEAA